MKRSDMLKSVLAATLVFATASFAAEGAAAVKGNPDSKIYHKSECRFYNSKSSTKEFASEAEAKKAGYTACKKCGAAKADKKEEKKK